MQSQVEGFRLSPQQRRLWLHGQGGVGGAYVSQCAVLVEGELRAGALERAVAGAVARHEILRTTFYRPPGIKIPIQLIHDSAAPAWREARAGGRGAREEAEALLASEAESPFDVERGPLLRVALLALSPRSHLLTLTAPAFCADSRTLKNLFGEIVNAYAAAGDGDARADDPVQYVQFAEWQNELLEDAEAAAGRQHWRGPRWERLAAPRLPFENTAPARAAFEPRAHAVNLGPELSGKILSAAARRGVSAQDFMLACWQTLLWRLSGEREFLLGYRVAGRKYEELEEACGPFEKFVPVRADLEGGLAFGALLGRVREEADDAAAWHEYFSAEGESKAAPAAADLPFLHVCFEHEELPPGVSAAGAHFSVLSLRSCSDRFRLKLSTAREADSLRAELGFDPSAFGAEGVGRIAAHFAVLLESAAGAAEGARLRDLEILSGEERRMLLSELNQSAADLPRELCAHELFERQAARTPDRVAVRFGESFLTYAELNRRANRLAHHLRRRGVVADTPVAFCVERSPLMIVGLLGILKAGGAYVPLDPDHPKARLNYQLEDTRAALLVTQESLVGRFEGFAGEFVRLDDETLFAGEPGRNPPAATSAQNLCYVIYTSGSTGRPKGVAVSHQSLVNYSLFICGLVRRAEAEREAAHFATVTTLSADLGNTVVFPSLFSGGCLHVLGYEVVTDGQAFARYATENPLDVLKIVPSHLRALLASREQLDYLPKGHLVLGGEALTPELVARVREGAPSCRVVNHYGPTETTVGSLAHVVAESAAASGEGPAPSVPIGRPVANTEVFILDAELLPAPAGVPGELYIGGAGLARGYLNKPAQTAERFVPHPFARTAGARLYRTGDLVKCLPAAQVEFLGRVDHQVKVRGFRIELGEIELALSEHADVREAVVLAYEDEPGRKRLVAYVVPERGASGLAAGLRSHLSERVPEYMIPSAFITLKALPLTTNGKVDRQALPAPDEAALHGERAYVAPRNGVEQTLAEIWAQTLGVERVGVHDNFFELGGDSILSIQIVARANQAGLRITLKQLFEHRTVEELAGVAVVLKEAAADDDGPVTGEVELTPIQHWFFELELPDPHHFNQSLLFEPSQPLDPEALRGALAALVAHHDQLRARFARDGQRGWRQTVAAPDAAAAGAAFEHVDLRPAPEGRRGAALEAEAERVQRSLDLASGPLARLALFELGDGHQRLLIVIHHLVIDGVSWRVLLEDLQAAYDQLSRGEGARLAPKTASFKRWAEHLRGYARTDAVRGEADYWLGGERAAVKGLPVDARGENTAESARGVTVSLSAERTRALLRDVSRAYGTHIDEVLLASVGEALRRWTRERLVLVEVEGHGREEAGEGAPDVSRTVGWFTTHYPVLLQMGEVFRPDEALKSVKEQVRGVPGRGLGYGLLRYVCEEAGVREALRALPPAEVSFNYLGQLDRVLAEGALLRPAREAAGHERSPRARRTNLLQIDGKVEDGRLQLIWSYSEAVHRRETVEGVARECAAVLEELIDHCLSVEARGYTPSDFPLAGLDERQLNAVINKVKGRPSR